MKTYGRIWLFAAQAVLIAAFTWSCGGGGDGSSSGPSYRVVKTWGPAGPGEFYDIAGVAVDPSGNVYVADNTGSKVQKFSSSGVYVSSWGSYDPYGTENGKFVGLMGIAVDPSGNVYSAEGNNRVQKFNSSGTFLAKWTTYVDTFCDEIAAGPSGEIYTVCSKNNNYYIDSWSSTGALGSFSVVISGGTAPVAIAADSSGSVYAALNTNTVRKYGSNGSLVTSWGSPGSGNGQFNTIKGIAVAADGLTVYVLDAGNSRIQTFTSADAGLTYTYAAQWGGAGTGDGQFTDPTGIALDAAGANLYVGDSGNGRVQKFSTAGAFQAKWGVVWSAADPVLHSPSGMAVDTDGDVYVVDSFGSEIKKYDLDGNFLARWGSAGAGNGQFNLPNGIAVDTAGNVYVADTGNNRIQKFTKTDRTTYAYSTQWGGPGGGSGTFNNPRGVAVDSTGAVYVGDAGNNLVQKFTTADGTTYSFSTQWGGPGSGNGQFNEPRGVAVDSSDNIYVADAMNNRIQKFDSSGGYLAQWSSDGFGGTMNGPSSIAVDTSGNVYVTDVGNGFKFSSSGTLLVEFIDNQPLGIAPLAVDSTGSIYVAMYYQHAIWKYRWQ